LRETLNIIYDASKNNTIPKTDLIKKLNATQNTVDKQTHTGYYVELC